MKHLKLSLIDNDFLLHAETDLNFNDKAVDAFTRFLHDVEEKLVTGETAYLEIEGVDKDSIKLAISHPE